MEQMVTNLFDAVRYADQVRAAKGAAKQLTEESEGRMMKIDGFAREVAASAKKLTDKGGVAYLDNLSAQVNEFVKAAADQAKAREKKELAGELSESTSRGSSEATKAFKSLESYFASSPLPIMDRVLTVKRGTAGYEAEAFYACRGDINYRFTLATQNSNFFRSDFRFSLFGKKLNVPVELAKTWIKKEPTPRFEKLERYVLTSAEVSERHTILDLENQETKARFRIVGSTTDGEGFATIEYVEDAKTVKVTSDSGLNKHVDRNSISAAIQELRAELLSLEKNRAALTELTSNGEDILEELRCGELLAQILRLMGATYGGLVERMKSRPMPTKNGTLDMPLLRERLALLGPSSASVRNALSIK